MSMRLVVAVVAPLLLLTACGSPERATDIAADPAGTPYAGPMDVPPDFGDRATPTAAGGSAALALECTGPPRRSGGGDYVDSGLESVQDTPEEALANLIGEEGLAIPADGYRVERVEDGRVLLSYDVRGRTVVAAIVRDDVTDVEDDTGWGVESWSSCDPAELGVEVAEGLGFQIWTDANGAPVPTTDLLDHTELEFCDYAGVDWIQLGYDSDIDRDYEIYVSGNGDGGLNDYLSTAADPAADLPEDAVDTGWQHDGRELWTGKRPRAAYLVRIDDPDDVHLRPAVTRRIACG